MRLGRRLATGVAEHPPAREPLSAPPPDTVERAEVERPAGEAVPAEIGAER